MSFGLVATQTRGLQSVRQIEATDFSNWTIAATLQEFGYLITKDGVIDRQIAGISK
jgi:hypothetical protein